MNKLRFDYFLSIGGKPEKSDVFAGVFGVLNEFNPCNKSHQEDLISNYATIYSFTWRKNEGTEPVGNLPVIAIRHDDLAIRELSGAYYWKVAVNDASIVKWKYDIEKLIEMQNEHDKVKAKKRHNGGSYTNPVAETPEEKEVLDTIDNSITPTPEEMEKLMKKKQVTAKTLLQEGIDLINQRGEEYDKSGAERSFAAVATCFNAKTGKDITAAEVCLILQDLKDVRQWSDDRLHEDSVIDCVNYSALKGEELHKQYSK